MADEASYKEGQNKEGQNDLWKILKDGTPNTGRILAIRADAQQINEIRKLLESQERLRGIDVAKW